MPELQPIEGGAEELPRGGSPPDDVHHTAYWRANLKVVALLLFVWAFVSYGCGILFAPALNAVNLPGTGFPLGFWFAQQGSIYTFVVLIFVYVAWMNRIDRRFGVAEDDPDPAVASPSTSVAAGAGDEA